MPYLYEVYTRRPFHELCKKMVSELKEGVTMVGKAREYLYKDLKVEVRDIAAAERVVYCILSATIANNAGLTTITDTTIRNVRHKAEAAAQQEEPIILVPAAQHVKGIPAQGTVATDSTVVGASQVAQGTDSTMVALVYTFGDFAAACAGNDKVSTTMAGKLLTTICSNASLWSCPVAAADALGRAVAAAVESEDAAVTIANAALRLDTSLMSGSGAVNVAASLKSAMAGHDFFALWNIKGVIGKTKASGGTDLYLVDWEAMYEPPGNIPRSQILLFEQRKRHQVGAHFELEAEEATPRKTKAKRTRKQSKQAVHSSLNLHNTNSLVSMRPIPFV